MAFPTSLHVTTPVAAQRGSSAHTMSCILVRTGHLLSTLKSALCVRTAKRAPQGFPGFLLFWTAESSGGLRKGSCIQLFQKPISSRITIGHFLFGTWFRQRGFYMYHVPPDSLKRKPGIWNLGLFFCLLTERLAGYLVNTVLFLMSL